jgi:segregation and condensation protein A
VTDPATSATEPADRGRTPSASADIPGAAPRLAVDGFDGPLDLLLVLARAQQIDLARLSIAALIEAFADALQAALAERAGARLEHWAVWTVMAASLTELWSRLKLPPSAPEARAAAAEAEALRRQLIGRAEIEAAATWLAQRPHLGQDVFRRGQRQRNADDAARGSDLTDLLRACLPVLRVPDAQAVALRPRAPPLWTATDAIRQVARLLAKLPNGSPLAAFLPKIDREAPKRPLRCRAAVASTLIASLELARDGTVALEQDGDWMPIRLGRHPCVESVPDAARTEDQGESQPAQQSAVAGAEVP